MYVVLPVPLVADATSIIYANDHLFTCIRPFFYRIVENGRKGELGCGTHPALCTTCMQQYLSEVNVHSNHHANEGFYYGVGACMYVYLSMIRYDNNLVLLLYLHPLTQPQHSGLGNISNEAHLTHKCLTALAGTASYSPSLVLHHTYGLNIEREKFAPMSSSSSSA